MLRDHFAHGSNRWGNAHSPLRMRKKDGPVDKNLLIFVGAQVRILILALVAITAVAAVGWDRRYSSDGSRVSSAVRLFWNKCVWIGMQGGCVLRLCVSGNDP